MHYKTFNEVERCNEVVASGVRSGIPKEIIIVELANQIEAKNRQIEELMAITPKRILVNGKVYTWHCPDELVPIT